MAVIYGLFDPREPIELENCRYVGKTKAPPSRRLVGHLSHARIKNCTPRDKWINKLLDESVRPFIYVLEHVPDSMDIDVHERHWISEGRRLNWGLLNVSDGGDGQSPGFQFSEEQRADLSRIVIQRHLDDPGIAERKRASQMRRFSDPLQRELTGAAISKALATRDKSDVWCELCGAGPFEGAWALKSHMGNYDHEKIPTYCSQCSAGPFVGTHGLSSHVQHRHGTVKEPMMCECGAGPFMGVHGLGLHKGQRHKTTI